MKCCLLLLKIAFAPVWIPFWIIKKGWRLFAVLLFGALIAGCAINSAKLNKSPCACDFQPLNHADYVGEQHA